MKVYAYCRRSSDETDKQVYSLDAQKRVIDKYTKEHNYTVSEVIDESHSAWAKKRPLWTKLLKESTKMAKRGEDILIIAHKVDRFTRHRRDYAAIDAAVSTGVKIEFVEGRFADTAAGKLTFGMFVLLAQFYSDNLSEEVKKGQSEAIEKKLYPGNHKAGYLKRPDKHTPRQVNDEEAWKIRDIFQRIANGEPTQDVCRWAREIVKLKNYTGGIIPRSKFYSILRDPFYTGKFIWKGQIYQGNHDPIISEHLFRKIQDVLSGRSHIKENVHEYLFDSLGQDDQGN